MLTIWCWAIRPLPSVNGIVNTSGSVPRRERRGERRRRPVVLLGLDVDPGVLRLELADLQVQGVDRLLGRAGPQGADDDRRPARGRRRDRRWRRPPGAGAAAADGAEVAVDGRRPRRAWRRRRRRRDRRVPRLGGDLIVDDSSRWSAPGPMIDRIAVPRPTAVVVHQLLLIPLPLSAGRPPGEARDPGGSTPSHREAGARLERRAGQQHRRRRRGSASAARRQVGDAHEPIAAREREHAVGRRQPARATRRRGPGSARRMRSAARYRLSIESGSASLGLDGQRRPARRAGGSHGSAVAPSGLKPNGALVAGPRQRDAAAVAAGIDAAGAEVHRVLELVDRQVLDLVEAQLVALVDVQRARAARRRGGPPRGRAAARGRGRRACRAACCGTRTRCPRGRSGSPAA